MQKIGLGIVTYNRPKYLQRTLEGVIQHILPYVDRAIVYNDGSTENYSKVYKKMDKTPIQVLHNTENHGVAHAKNQLFKALIPDCDFMFILEDDVVPVHKNAVIGYMAAAKMTGMDHFMFAHHGPANQYAVDIKGPIAFWPSCVGAYTFYARETLLQVGLMDENFINAWEHVEHTWRILKYHNLRYGYYPDVLGSEEWLKEIPGSIDNSSIGQQDNPARIKIILDGLHYWKKKDADFPAQHTLDHYANLLQEMEERNENDRGVSSL